VHGVDQRKEVVDIEVFLVGEVRQVGAAAVGRLGQR
jgi:hypothetical protein